MPGGRCAIASCNSYWDKAKKEGRKISFHRFPKEHKKKKIWIDACNQNNGWNPSTSYICSIHFSENDYESNLRARLMPDVVSVRRLKKTAVPRYFLKNEDRILDATGQDYFEKGQNERIVDLNYDELEIKHIDTKNEEEIVILVEGNEMENSNNAEYEEFLQSNFEEVVSENNKMKAIKNQEPSQINFEELILENKKMKQTMLKMQQKIDLQNNEIARLKSMLEASDIDHQIPINKSNIKSVCLDQNLCLLMDNTISLRKTPLVIDSFSKIRLAKKGKAHLTAISGKKIN